jgi:hypothetical protein
MAFFTGYELLPGMRVNALSKHTPYGSIPRLSVISLHR